MRPGTNIPIVVVAFNRPAALDRLLGSLEKAAYDGETELIVSIDGGGDPEVISLARSFSWRHGPKRVIVRETNLGLRRHILACGDIALEHDGVIVLEDDLFVSPAFHRYSVQAAHHYADDPRIAGIGLYAHRYNETAGLPFEPLADAADVFFMQLACSWGQCWLKDQWAAFRQWYAEHEHEDLSRDDALPGDILLWPDSSWKKYYIRYMIDTDRYFVYPRTSLTTNFGDAGTHHKGTSVFQVPLLMEPRQWRFSPLHESAALYDCFCEIVPDRLKRLNPRLPGGEFSVDLYGMKERRHVDTEHVLTAKECSYPVMSFGRTMRPIESNVIHDIAGSDIAFGRPEDCAWFDDFVAHRNAYSPERRQLDYFYAMTTLHHIVDDRNQRENLRQKERMAELKERVWLLEHRARVLDERLRSVSARQQPSPPVKSCVKSAAKRMIPKRLHPFARKALNRLRGRRG